MGGGLPASMRTHSRSLTFSPPHSVCVLPKSLPLCFRIVYKFRSSSHLPIFVKESENSILTKMLSSSSSRFFSLLLRFVFVFLLLVTPHQTLASRDRFYRLDGPAAAPHSTNWIFNSLPKATRFPPSGPSFRHNDQANSIGLTSNSAP